MLDQVLDVEQINVLQVEIRNINKKIKQQKQETNKNNRNELLCDMTKEAQHKLLETGSCDYSNEQLSTMMHLHDSI